MFFAERLSDCARPVWKCERFYRCFIGMKCVVFRSKMCLAMVCVTGGLVWPDPTYAQGSARSWPDAVSQSEAVASLPASDPPLSHPLPTWARTLLPSLPHTVASLLELEYLYRSTPHLAETRPIAVAESDWDSLPSVIRYVVSDTHQSAYGIDIAKQDHQRQARRELDPARWTPLEKEVAVFSKQLAEAGRTITDSQYTSLRSQLGDEAMVGLVLRVAHGCFQDRLLWGLGIADIADGFSPPIEIRFRDSTANGANTPTAVRMDNEAMLASVERDRQLSERTNGIELNVRSQFQQWEDQEPTDASWRDLGGRGLQSLLEKQRERQPRIAVPEWDWIAERIPNGLYRRPLRIRWSRVVVGYQTRLGPAWIKCLRVFEQEAHQNRVFEESVFWIVTRSLRCFYCMGHCEMLMEVGGLKSAGIADRSKRLASGDWSSFSKAEQVSYAFAKKLTETPTKLLASDREALLRELGDVRARDLIWWASRCQYMTKVSDAFQLQLERENVFAD